MTVIELTPDILEQFQDQHSVLLFEEAKDETKKNSQNELYKELSKSFENSKDDLLKFYKISKNEDFATRLYSFIGIKQADAEKVSLVLLDFPNKKRFVFSFDSEFNLENAKNFVQGFLDGTLESFKKSEDRPQNDADPDNPNIKLVVRSTFEELVLNSNETVFLLAHTNWCPPCIALKPVFSQIATILKDVKGLTLARVNTQFNDIEKEYLPEDFIPVLKLFKSGDKKNWVNYEDERDHASILKWLHSQLKDDQKFDLDSALKAVEEEKKKANKNVVHVESKEEFDTKLKEADEKNQLVVIDFTASWCGPCRMMKPIFAQFSENHSNSVFLSVDVDQLEEVAATYEVNCMPTFVLLKKGNVVHRIEGADKNELEEKIKENQ